MCFRMEKCDRTAGPRLSILIPESHLRVVHPSHPIATTMICLMSLTSALYLFTRFPVSVLSSS